MSVTPARKSTTWLIQFQWLLWRSFVDSYRNPAVHALRIAQKIVIFFSKNRDHFLVH